MSEKLNEARRKVETAQGSLLATEMAGAPLTEASLARVYTHWLDKGFAIVSADRGERDKAENNRARRTLKSAIRAAGYGFIPLDGFWRETDARTGEENLVSERSFLIPDHKKGGDLRDLVVRWGKLDSGNPQESVIMVNPGGPVEFLDPKNGSVQFTLKRFVPGKVSDIYSKLRKRRGPGAGKGSSFVFEGWRFTSPPTNQAEAYRRKNEGETTFVSLPGDDTDG